MITYDKAKAAAQKKVQEFLDECQPTSQDEQSLLLHGLIGIASSCLRATAGTQAAVECHQLAAAMNLHLLAGEQNLSAGIH